MVRYYLKSLHVKTGENVSDVKLSVAEEVNALLFCNFKLVVAGIVMVVVV